MKNFRQYLEESVRESHFVVKMAMKPTDEQIDAIETTLKRYDLLELSKPELFEEDSLDFKGIPNRQVWSMNVSLGMPLTQYILLQQLKTVAHIPEDLIIVRSVNEPVELEVNADVFRKDGLTPAARLSTDRLYADEEQPLVTDLYGDEYNKKFVDYLANVKATRKSEKYEAPTPLFSWIQMDKAMAEQAVDSVDFNEKFDTVKPVSKGKDTPPVDKKYLGPQGNLNDSAAKNVKFVKKTPDARGEAISAPRTSTKAKR